MSLDYFYACRRTWIIAFTAVLGGCAGLDVEPLGVDAERDRNARGFRYYQSAPFLFVHSDGKGGLTGEIKYLPDTTQKMSAQPYAYLSTNETKLQFSGGMLTQATETLDSTTLPTAALDSLSKVLVAAAKGSMNLPETGVEGQVPVPYLFRIVIRGDSVTLVGGAPKDANRTQLVIKVTLPKTGGGQ